MDGRRQSASGRWAERLAGAREWFRRAMPRVALAAGALFLLRLFVRDTPLYKDTALGLLGPVTFCVVSAVVLYYGLKLLVRLKRMLLLALGALAATGGSSQAMVRVVTVEIDATERQALETARALAEALGRLPP